MISCLLDAGNSRIKLASYAHGQWQFIAALSFDSPDFIDRCCEIFSQGAFDAIYVASVSKGPRAAQLALLLQKLTVPIRHLHSQSGFGRLKIAYANPHQFGVDRFLGLLAASDSACNCVVLSFGTALTLDVLDAQGQHRGGLIAPSPEFQRQKMREHFPSLFDTEGINTVLANTTANSLSSGIAQSTLGLVERVVRLTLSEQTHRLIITGGGAREWLAELPQHTEHIPELVFAGMAAYIQKASA